MKFMTFGEIMLRLKSPGQECLFQSPMLEATFGGGEANVAVSLANYGCKEVPRARAATITRLLLECFRSPSGGLKHFSLPGSIGTIQKEEHT